MIRHVVLFRAQENQFDRVLEGLKILEQIPHASLCEVRPNLKLDEWCQEIYIKRVQLESYLDLEL